MTLPRFSLRMLLAITAVVSLYATSAKSYGMNQTAILVIELCAIAMLVMAIRILFFNR